MKSCFLLSPFSFLLSPFSSLLTPHSLLLTPYSSLLTPYSSLLTPYSLLKKSTSFPGFRDGFPGNRKAGQQGSGQQPARGRVARVWGGPANGSASKGCRAMAVWLGCRAGPVLWLFSFRRVLCMNFTGGREGFRTAGTDSAQWLIFNGRCGKRRPWLAAGIIQTRRWP